MSTEYVERTDSGHEVRIYYDGNDELHLDFTVVGVQLIVNGDGHAVVTMQIDEARQINAIVREALTWYDERERAMEANGHQSARALYTALGDLPPAPGDFTLPAFQRGWQEERTVIERERCVEHEHDAASNL